jgi:hypothetical protein
MRARRRPDLPNLSAALPFARVGEGQRILSAEGSIIGLRPPAGVLIKARGCYGQA